MSLKSPKFFKAAPINANDQLRKAIDEMNVDAVKRALESGANPRKPFDVDKHLLDTVRRKYDLAKPENKQTLRNIYDALVEANVKVKPTLAIIPKPPTKLAR